MPLPKSGGAIKSMYLPVWHTFSSLCGVDVACEGVLGLTARLVQQAEVGPGGRVGLVQLDGTDVRLQRVKRLVLLLVQHPAARRMVVESLVGGTWENWLGYLLVLRTVEIGVLTTNYWQPVCQTIWNNVWSNKRQEIFNCHNVQRHLGQLQCFPAFVWALDICQKCQ